MKHDKQPKTYFHLDGKKIDWNFLSFIDSRRGTFFDFFLPLSEEAKLYPKRLFLDASWAWGSTHVSNGALSQCVRSPHLWRGKNIMKHNAWPYMEIDAGFSLSDSRCLGCATRRYITFRSHLSYCLARWRRSPLVWKIFLREKWFWNSQHFG